MKIVINGEEKIVSDKLSIQQLLQDLDMLQQKLALEVNQEIVPRSTFSKHVLQPGDIVEIIHAIGGG